MDPHERRQEQKKGLDRRALSARAVHEALRSEGQSELQRPWTGLGWSGIASGISIGLSLVAEGLLQAHLPATEWRTLVSSLGYTVGFVAVTLGRQQLYTETTLTAILPLLHDRRRQTAGSVLRLWVVVLLGNLLGAAVFAWGASRPTAFDPELRATFAEIARTAMDHSPGSAFVRAIFGGWIIALMVWLLPSAETARLWVIILMTYLIAALDLTHIIAGSVEGFYGIFTGHVSFGTYLLHFALPVLLGNSIGGVLLVAALNHAQTVAGEPD